MALEELWFRSDQHQAGAYLISGLTLVAGVQYKVTVDGNWQAWNNETRPYGTTDEIKYPLPSNPPYSAGEFDAEWWYSSYDTPSAPFHNHCLRWTLDGSTNWTGGAAVGRVEPITGTTYHSDHVYEYIVTGTGNKMRINGHDVNNSANNGMVKITIEEHSGWMVGAIAAG